MDSFMQLEKLVQDEEDIAGSIKHIIYLESELIEIGFRIQTMLGTLKEKGNILLQILLGDKHNIAGLMQLIEPRALIILLEEAENLLPKEVTFPREKNKGILTGLVNLMQMTFRPTSDQTLDISITVPLVLRKEFVAYRGFVTPHINGSLMTSITLEKDVLIKEDGENWGFVITHSEYESCDHISDKRICDFPTKETLLTQGGECILNMKYRNSTEQCEIKIIKVEKEMWLETEDPNTWEYIAPSKLKIELFHGSNHSYMTVIGSGKVKLTPGMWLRTNSTRIEHTNTTSVDASLLLYKLNFNMPIFTIKDWEIKRIPTLDANGSIFSFYDHKKLFDVGVNIEDLKKKVPTLENMIYSPLSSNWTIVSVISGAIIMLAGITIWLWCCFKGSITCSRGKGNAPLQQLKRKPTLRGQEIIHNVPGFTSGGLMPREGVIFDNVRNTFANPNLASHGDILMQAIRELPIIEEVEDDYMEPNMVPVTKTDGGDKGLPIIIKW